MNYRVPPGFRFHPTDEELCKYYLRRKVSSEPNGDLDVIKDIDLYKIEPWDLQELCRIGTDEQSDWYFFSHKDKKYPTGTRTNRATTAGFWKATGRDKAIYSKQDLVGMRKTLVFYKGRAPNGQKSDWIMHEYRLETDENGAPQEEGWVVCRVFKKRIAATQRFMDPSSPSWFDDQVSFMPEVGSPKLHPYANYQHHNFPNYNNSCKREMEAQYGIPPDQFLQLPLLESPKMMQPQTMPGCNQVNSYGPGPSMYPAKDLGQSSRQIHDHQNFQSQMFANVDSTDQVTDWRVLDKFVASQLSQDIEIAKEKDEFMNEDSNMAAENLNTQEMSLENTSNPSTSCPTDIWK